jgi:acetyl-CoA C-acetyltransferase
MGEAADTLADLLGITRERQDDYAARSHELTIQAQLSGRYQPEIIAVQDFCLDERPRKGMTATRLSRLRPAFGPHGTATAGNSCGISDGAAAVAVCTERPARDSGLPYLRIIAATVSAGRPDLPGLGPAPAVRRLMNRPAVIDRGIGLGDIGAFEITEAFASVVLAVIDDLGIDQHKVCAEGGAIGLGHPWGASGTILLLRLASRMLGDDNDGSLGIAACAIGGGQGLAVLVERPDT